MADPDDTLIPIALDAFVRSHLGAYRVVAQLGGPFSEADVYVLQRAPPQQATAPAPLPVVLKVHRRPAGHATEARAYAAWGQALEAWLPRLIAASTQPRALLLSWLSGASAERPAAGRRQSAGPPTHVVNAHRAAGRFVAALQALPVAEVDPMALDEAVARRRDGWLRRSARTLPGDLRAVAAAAVVPERFAGVSRVPAHRDFRPGNWRWDGARLGVIDLGHARPDAPMADLVKLAAGPWRAQPALKDAFLAGYGQPISASQERQLRALIALHGLATATWAQRHGDAGAYGEGLDVLRWLREGS